MTIPDEVDIIVAGGKIDVVSGRTWIGADNFYRRLVRVCRRWSTGGPRQEPQGLVDRGRREQPQQSMGSNVRFFLAFA